MKKIIRIAALLAVTLAMVFAASSSVFASSFENTDVFTQTGRTSKSITFKVDLSKFTPQFLPDTAASWTVTDWTITDTTSDMVAASGTTSQDVTITKPSAYAAKYQINITYSYTTSYGTYTSDDFLYCCGSTKPATLNKKNIDLELWSSLGKGVFSVAQDAYATGAEFQCVNVKTGASKKYIAKYTYTNDIQMPKNVPFKFRARNYYANETTGETYYGDYSGYKYFINVDGSCSNHSSRNGINIKLKGAKNVKYQIWVATSNNGNYKLTKTVTPKAGKSISYLINKIGKKNMSKSKEYYFKIIPYINGNKSESVFTTSAYNYWF